MPCIWLLGTPMGEWSIVPGLRLSAFARAKLDVSVAELSAEAAAVESLGLI